MSQEQDIYREFLGKVNNALLKIGMLNTESAIRVLEDARDRNAFVWLIGNGGSASTASHFANDLEKICGIKAISVPDMTSVVTAHANDEGMDKMFSKVLGAYSSQCDVLVVFSCSGESMNVINAARNWPGQNPAIYFTGNNRNSKLHEKTYANAVLFVDDPDIKVQESVHLALCHAIVEVLQRSKS